MPVMTVARTIRDCAASGTDPYQPQEQNCARWPAQDAYERKVT